MHDLYTSNKKVVIVLKVSSCYAMGHITTHCQLDVIGGGHWDFHFCGFGYFFDRFFGFCVKRLQFFGFGVPCRLRIFHFLASGFRFS